MDFMSMKTKLTVLRKEFNGPPEFVKKTLLLH